MWPEANAPTAQPEERSLVLVNLFASPLRLSEVRELMRDEYAGMPGAEERLRVQSNALVRMLDSPYSEDALAALDLLVRFRDEDAAGSIVPLLARPELEYEAVLALGELGEAEALTALGSKFARSPVAEEIAIAIGRIGGVPARRALETLLQQEREEQRRALLLGAFGLMEPDIAARALALRLDESAARWILTWKPSEYMPPLRALLDDRDPRVVRAAVRALQMLHDRQALPQLQRLLSSEVALDAARALVALGSEEALESVFLAAAHKPVLGSAFAGAPDAERFLARRLEEGRFTERVDALRWLAVCGTGRSVSALDRAASDPALRPLAIEVLGAVGRRDDIAVSVLSRHAGKRDVRRAAIDALGATGQVGAVEPLQALAVDRDTTRTVVRALGRIRAPEAVRGLFVLARQRPECERDVLQALSRFDRHLVCVVLEEGEADPALRRVYERIPFPAEPKAGKNVRRPKV
jgi:HEAT repeat protein